MTGMELIEKNDRRERRQYYGTLILAAILYALLMMPEVIW